MTFYGEKFPLNKAKLSTRINYADTENIWGLQGNILGLGYLSCCSKMQSASQEGTHCGILGQQLQSSCMAGARTVSKVGLNSLQNYDRKIYDKHLAYKLIANFGS